MAERRSLWGSISMSEKVNKLSLPAALFYTWTIPHEDDFGYIEGDLKHLKAVIVPYREEKCFSTHGNSKEFEKLVNEIANVHRIVGSSKPLWTLYTVNGKRYIKDEYFEERQSFKAVHRKPSKIKAILDSTLSAPSLHPSSTQEVQSSAKEVPKLSRSEEKRSRSTPNVDNSVEISTQKSKPKGDDGNPFFLSTDTRTEEEFNQSLRDTYPSIYEKTMGEINEWFDNNPDTFKDPSKKRKFILTRFIQAHAQAKQLGVEKP